MPKLIKGQPSELKRPEAEDLIIMSGGLVGKDGIHGVTASSEIYSESTPAGHVQIGDPYTQKKMHDFLLEARDEGLISFITDNGGGGLSSSIGESALLSGGAFVELDKVPLKYEGLDVWEIWVSESQERMTVAVHPEHLDRFMALSKKHEVESTVIGCYKSNGKLHLTYKGETCAYLDLSLFTEDFPQWEFDAHWRSPEARGMSEPVLSQPQDYTRLLHDILQSANVSSREWIQRQYDHEVQGGSVVKFLCGRERDVPNDAVVMRPVLESNRGLAVAQALNPTYSMIDTYDMVAVTIDETVRRILSVGAQLDKIGGVDNFCWPNIQYDPELNPDGRHKAAQLVRANWALRDICLAYGIPLLSGKDSMYVDGHLEGRYGDRHKISGLPTMQFTATGLVPDFRNCLTMESKLPGDLVYVLGETLNELGGSEYYEILGHVGVNVPQVRVETNLALYRAVEEAIRDGLIASCHGIYRGGLLVHAALVAMGSLLGMKLELASVPKKLHSSSKPQAKQEMLRNDQILFSESSGRFLVTISPHQQGQFEARFHNLPFALVGEVTPQPYLSVKGISGDLLINEPVAELKASWKGAPTT